MNNWYLKDNKTNTWFVPAGYDLIEHWLRQLTRDDFVEANKNGISFVEWQRNVATAIMAPIRNCRDYQETYDIVLEHVKTFSKKYDVQNMFTD